MSQQQFESSVKVIPHQQSDVYAKLSDLNNLAQIKHRLDDPTLQEALREQMSEEKMNQMRDTLKNLRMDADSVTASVPPVGDVCLRIIEREEPKCVKFEAENSPVPLNLWIQLVPTDNDQCKMKLTVRADINPFIKMMISKPLQEGVDKLADMLAMIPYGSNLFLENGERTSEES